MYSALVVTIETKRGKALTKELKDDTQQILSELHEYHTKSEMAQYENVELTMYVTIWTLSKSKKPSGLVLMQIVVNNRHHISIYICC